ncbi:hypothetical protein ETD86_29070 [Nonomuraea turkmeniaca]|uniref:Uncharacterized protein n=1 Tax=Nonomuraea turkmeniaca TaxID=103838 RepID=A0A5S4FAP0_9ACTN|nr:hypothetical protein [Nonomuraea turkmeniaca]TMR14317.1 hypothetical protein ETD86_29070 [Nonomuraea turkmeniaca]
MAEHLARNPFPARGTASAAETVHPEMLREWADRTPTAPLPGVRDAERLAEEYARDFQDETTRHGGLGCLYGAHGAGKTHAARHMMATVHRREPDAVQLYVRFQDDDLVAAYRRLVPQLSQGLLTDLIVRYLGTLAGDQAANAGVPADRGRLMSALDTEPTRVFDLFDAHLIEAGRVLEAQAREIAAVTGDGQRFQRALSFLIRPEFSDAAYDWLCGRPIGLDAARALGVGEQIGDPQTCRYGLQLLATLVTRSGRPFVLIFDQCEKFLLDDGVPVPANLGLLQSLVEVVPRAGGLLLLVASEAGWQAMPPDLHQRIGPGAIHMMPLVPDDARLVLRVYLDALRDPPREDIRPITEAGLRELLRHSGGNVRLLLQLAWASFEAARGADIDAEVAGTAALRYRRAPVLAELSMLVESKLLAAGLAVERVPGEDRSATFRLPGPIKPQVVIKLSEAVFFDDEVSNAADMVAPGGDISSAYTALLVTGYVSPPVLTALRRVVHTVLVADGSPAFSRELDALVARAASMVAAKDRPSSDPALLSETLRELRAYLEELGSQRRGESVALGRNLAVVGRPPEPGAASGWPATRTDLTRRIAEARAVRAKADWDGFRKARQHVIREWRTQLALVIGAVVVAALLLAAGLALDGTLPLLAGALVIAVAGAIPATRLARSWVRRPGAPLDSRADLDQLGRELRRYARPGATDPVIRYAHAGKEDPDKGFETLMDAIRMEPLALVRQAIGRRLATTERCPAECVQEIRRGLRERIPEVLLLLARRQHHTDREQLSRTLWELPPELRILVALANPGQPQLAAGAPAQHPAELVLAALGARGTSHPLARGYRSGVAQLAPGEFPPNELRAAARLLSPLEPDGLGGYDWLPLVPEIDELYLYFEELLYYQEEIRSYRHKS